MSEMLVFRAADRSIGVPALNVHRIIDDADILPVPAMPPFYMGVLYHRGELFDVIHAGAVLYSSPPVRYTGSRRIILMKWDGHRIALAPDSVEGLVPFARGEDVQLVDPGNIRERALELQDGFI